MKIRQYLLFSLWKERFGIDVDNVLRVINLERLMKVPKAPAYIQGAISVEGNVIPVVDLGQKIQLENTTITPNTKVIVLQVVQDHATTSIGVMVDEVSDVVSIQENKLLPPPLDGLGFDTQTTDGMYKLNDDYYMILNVVKIFEKELTGILEPTISHD